MTWWDLEWFDTDSTPLEQRQDLTHDDAELQAQQWLKAKPGSRVYLYRRRGAVSVLVRVWNEG